MTYYCIFAVFEEIGKTGEFIGVEVIFIKKTNQKPSLKEINDYFIDKGIWTKFNGILFQVISNNPVHFIIKEFQYKKRIQLALFDVNKMCNFCTPFFDGMLKKGLKL